MSSQFPDFFFHYWWWLIKSIKLTMALVSIIIYLLYIQLFILIAPSDRSDATEPMCWKFRVSSWQSICFSASKFRSKKRLECILKFAKRLDPMYELEGSIDTLIHTEVGVQCAQSMSNHNISNHTRNSLIEFSPSHRRSQTRSGLYLSIAAHRARVSIF